MKNLDENAAIVSDEIEQAPSWQCYQYWEKIEESVCVIGVKPTGPQKNNLAWTKVI